MSVNHRFPLVPRTGILAMLLLMLLPLSACKADGTVRVAPVPTSAAASTPVPPTSAQEASSPTPAPSSATLTPATTTPSPKSTPIPIPPPSGSAASYPGVGYGMQIESGTDYPRALKLLTGAGFNWVKVQIRWEDMEPGPGQIQWDHWDYVVNTAQASGVRLLFSVVTAPSWSRPAGADLSVPGPPANVQEYARFVGALATRYRGRVHAYEIWNEQNLGREWGGAGKQNAAAYVAMLKAAHGAIKAADPAAVVLVGAPTPAGTVDLGAGVLAIDDVAYFRQMYQAGMKGFFDAVAVHPSGFNNAPALDPLDPAVLARAGAFHSHRSFYYRNFERYREVMVENGDANKQLWFTEFGWASDPKPFPEYAYATENSEQAQAQHLVQAFQIAKERGYVGPMFIWNLNYAPIADPDDVQAKRAFSILRPDWSPRPAYQALAVMPK